MPREGYSSITITNKLKAKLKKKAGDKSIPETIEFLLAKCEEA